MDMLKSFLAQDDVVWKQLLVIFLGSAVPVTEQRAAIPLGILFCHLNPMVVFLVSFLGSLLPVPFILLLFNDIFEWMKRFKFFNAINRYIEKKLDTGSKKVEKYKEIGLMLFVAIPLPTTGLWTGSAVACFLGMDFKKSFVYITLGGLISATIITLICVAFPAIFT